MKSVIYIDKPCGSGEKPVELNEFFDSDNGWVTTDATPGYSDKVLYLGHCEFDGDMFALYYKDCINIYKGHLNSGRYE
jgi:hypothetical protein